MDDMEGRNRVRARFSWSARAAHTAIAISLASFHVSLTSLYLIGVLQTTSNLADSNRSEFQGNISWLSNEDKMHRTCSKDDKQATHLLPQPLVGEEGEDLLRRRVQVEGAARAEDDPRGFSRVVGVFARLDAQSGGALGAGVADRGPTGVGRAARADAEVGHHALGQLKKRPEERAGKQ